MNIYAHDRHACTCTGDVSRKGRGEPRNARKWQGLPFLAEAFAALRAEDASFRLAVLSSDQKDFSCGDGIEIVSAVPHERVPAFLVECDILVIPRLYDRVSRLGPPSKLLEYMAMGKAVLVSALGYMDVIVEGGVNGRTYLPGDKEVFKRILRELKDLALRARLGQKALETVCERYTWKKEIEKLTEPVFRMTPR